MSSQYSAYNMKHSQITARLDVTWVQKITMKGFSFRYANNEGCHKLNALVCVLLCRLVYEDCLKQVLFAD